jgi:hypothetical protein
VVLEGADVGTRNAVAVTVHRDHVLVVVHHLARVDSPVDCGARGLQVEVVARRVNELRIRDDAVDALRELHDPAREKIVVLVEGSIGIPDLPGGAKDVAAHPQDVGAAARVADKSLTRTTGQHDGVAVRLGAEHGPVSTGRTSGDQEG